MVVLKEVQSQGAKVRLCMATTQELNFNLYEIRWNIFNLRYGGRAGQVSRDARGIDLERARGLGE